MVGRSRFMFGSVTVIALMSLGAAACGGDDGPALSEVGARGRSISISKGCAACHGTDGQGGSGPTWQGLAGSEVELLDGTMVLADDDYLTRAIVDPAAELRAGYNLQMPVNNTLTDADVAAMVAFINEISPPTE